MTPYVVALTFTQGFLSMGFQVVSSRLLAPYFGMTIIVWAVLISTFLAAFSAGAFLGGGMSRLAARRRTRALGALLGVGMGWFALVAFAGRPILRAIEATFEETWAGASIACVCLFFIPVVALSALLPIYAEVSGGTRRGAGAVSGVIYGTSTLGNITGVLVTAFLLVPKFATSELLVAWFVVSIVCVAGSLGLGNVERSLTARGGMS
jgi:hypothetical protein